MPAYTFYSLIIAMLISCQQQKQSSKPVNTDTEPVIARLKEQQQGKSNEALLQQYKNYLESLDKEKMQSVKEALDQYRWLFKERTPAVCDSAYAVFNHFYEVVYQHVQEHRPGKMNAAQKKKYAETIKPLGFQLAQYEGEDYHTQDRDSINPLFYAFVSPVMKEFMQQQHIETNRKSFVYEGGISISAEELANRYAFWQRFGFTHPAFLMKSTVLLYATHYEGYLLSGSENTPLRIDGRLNHIYRTAFEHLFTRYGDQTWATVFKPYYEALLKGDEEAIHQFKEWYDTEDNKFVLDYE
jgi:hypothetical protein